MVEATIGTVRLTVAVNEVADNAVPAQAWRRLTYAETPEPRVAREQMRWSDGLACLLGADLGCLLDGAGSARWLDATRRGRRREALSFSTASVRPARKPAGSEPYSASARARAPSGTDPGDMKITHPRRCSGCWSCRRTRRHPCGLRHKLFDDTFGERTKFDRHGTSTAWQRPFSGKLLKTRAWAINLPWYVRKKRETVPRLGRLGIAVKASRLNSSSASRARTWYAVRSPRNVRVAPNERCGS